MEPNESASPNPVAPPAARPTAPCVLCGRTFPVAQMAPVEILTPGVYSLLKKRLPEKELMHAHHYLCAPERGQLRQEYVADMLKEDLGEITTLEDEVLQSIRRKETLSENVDAELDEKLTLGDRMSDGIAAFGGSWKFIIGFTVILAGWIALNVLLAKSAFDPYPFILMNLLLSCLAAMQAPIIMMSQNRVAERDRSRAENDYQVNLKAELEIQHLNEKIDHLLVKQWQRLLEIQRVQTEMMAEITSRLHPCDDDADLDNWDAPPKA
jgi:uncharacterized membrane protein